MAPGQTDPDFDDAERARFSKKLDGYEAMGLEVTALRELLDEDLERFKDTYLGEIKAQLDGGGKEEPEPEPGLQRGKRRDWWPHMVMLKVLQSHYSATQDERVVDLMTKYFRYQLDTLPDRPLDNWTNWGRNRGGENLSSIYWLYNITGDRMPMHSRWNYLNYLRNSPMKSVMPLQIRYVDHQDLSVPT